MFRRKRRVEHNTLDPQCLHTETTIPISAEYCGPCHSSLARIRTLWNEPGPNPEYHREAQMTLRGMWPQMYHAIRKIGNEK